MSAKPMTTAQILAVADLADRLSSLGAPFKAVLSSGQYWPVLALGRFPQRAVCFCGDFEIAHAVSDALNAIAVWRATNADAEELSTFTRTERFTGSYADSFAA